MNNLDIKTKAGLSKDNIELIKKYLNNDNLKYKKQDYNSLNHNRNVIKRMAENYAREFIEESKNNIKVNKEYITYYILSALSDNTIATYVINETLDLLESKYGLDVNHNLSI